MAKDPAILFYFNDWHGGTITMSRHLKGCYMDLLCAQFNIGHLSLDSIKVVLGSDFGPAWPALQKKFKQDNEGLYYNERLFFESTKRKAFSASRRKNASAKHMPKHMENEIENRKLKIENEVKGVQGEIAYYRQFAHLKISEGEVSKLLDEGFTMQQIDDILDSIQNYNGNKKYTSLYLTARKWLKKDRDGEEKPAKASKLAGAKEAGERVDQSILNQIKQSL